MKLNRRQLLQLSAASAALVAGKNSLGSAPDKVQRNGTPKFKFSLAAYSYRSLLSGKEPKLTMSDFIADCAKFGLEGTELTSYYFPNPSSKYLRQLKRESFLLGLSISGTAVGNDFGHPKGSAKRQEQIAHVKRWVDHAEVMSAPVIRIFAGHHKKGVDAKTSHRLMVEGMEECCEYAGQHGVHLALENHGGPTATSEGLLKLVKDVKSPWLGVNLDTGNFRGPGDCYRQIEEVAEYAINVQVKLKIRENDKQVDADFKRLAKILRASGYRGFIVLEFEEKGNPREECPKYLNQLRAAFA